MKDKPCQDKSEEFNGKTTQDKEYIEGNYSFFHKGLAQQCEIDDEILNTER